MAVDIKPIKMTVEFDKRENLWLVSLLLSDYPYTNLFSSSIRIGDHSDLDASIKFAIHKTSCYVARQMELLSIIDPADDPENLADAL